VDEKWIALHEAKREIAELETIPGTLCKPPERTAQGGHQTAVNRSESFDSHFGLHKIQPG